jgi:glutamate racemase
MAANLPIGVFDSGVGGLTVVRALQARLPAEDILYLGDTARVPYGTRSADTVRRYSVNNARHLLGHGCKAIVIACNTASSVATDAVRELARVPVIDVIEPVAAAVAASSTTGRIAVLGTRGTVRSEAYLRALRRHRAELHIVQRACPLFVPLAEEGWCAGSIVEAIAHEYLDDLLRTENVDSVILGCTHYPMLIAPIARVVSEMSATHTLIHDCGHHTADALAAELERLHLLAVSGKRGQLRVLVTDTPDSVFDVGSRFLGKSLENVEHVDIS